MISISLSRIADGALAASALHSSPSQTTESRLLNRDDLPALRRTACDILATCLLQIAPMVLDTDIDTIDPAAGDDTVAIQLSIKPEHEPTARRAIEAAATATLLAHIHPTATDSLRTAALSLAAIAHMRIPRTFTPSA